MTLQFSDTVRNAQLDTVETTIGVSPTLELRTGAPPATPATADSGTVLATMALPSDWMAAASAGSKAKSGTWQDPSADATGRAGHFRIKQGATCHAQGRVSMPWAASVAVVVGEFRHNGGNIYVVTTAGTTASSGGPTGTGTGITDGTAVWDYVQTGVDMTIDNTSIATAQVVTVNTFTLSN